MRRLLLTLGIAALGCGPTIRKPGDSSEPMGPTERETQRIVRETFEKWNDANARGDVEASWSGMSGSLRQHWFWLRLRDRTDSITQAQLLRMDPEDRKIVDKWYEAHEKYNPQRAEMLPEPILFGRWLFDLYRETFMRARKDVEFQSKARKVLEVWLGEDGGVTIMTDTLGVHELYDMMFEGDGWKVNLSRPAPHRKK